eukprot:364697-Chlamydomonas_euryale.AAC.1
MEPCHETESVRVSVVHGAPCHGDTTAHAMYKTSQRASWQRACMLQRCRLERAACAALRPRCRKHEAVGGEGGRMQQHAAITGSQAGMRVRLPGPAWMPYALQAGMRVRMPGPACMPSDLEAGIRVRMPGPAWMPSDLQAGIRGHMP